MSEPEILRLDRPPPASARIIWPDDFGRRFAIFADAEEEFDWGQPFRRDTISTSAMAALPTANRRFVERGVVPTYMVDYPVAADARSAAILRALTEQGECDIGAQLHPWVNPPHQEALGAANSFAGNLPRDLEAAKIASLSERIEQAIGICPVAFRAGRYGVGPHSAELLVAAGYRLDVSARALFDYSGEGGPDFSYHPAWAWRAAPGLLALPLTAALTGPWRGRGLPRQRWRRALAARAGLVQRVALTPEDMPLGAVLDAIDVLLDEGQMLFSLSFHTPSLEPGHTPYVRDARDLDNFWRWWDAVFDRFARAGVVPIRANEIVAAADGLPA